MAHLNDIRKLCVIVHVFETPRGVMPIGDIRPVFNRRGNLRRVRGKTEIPLRVIYGYLYILPPIVELRVDM